MQVHDMGRTDAYNGMMVLDHTIDRNGCKFVDVSCVPTKATENATLYINGVDVLATGQGSHSVKLSCNKTKCG
ncbi:C6 domain protein [Necator americanus]|uniref:C6 domain protein n=1 Tax=Necator americanus TaxID=51031 RepID=W2TUM5_NECAM|nr:C6 domain protein [Necator americanus]ETN85339.1 C6 domain protein [Necator americanus]